MRMGGCVVVPARLGGVKRVSAIAMPSRGAIAIRVAASMTVFHMCWLITLFIVNALDLLVITIALCA